MHRSRTYAIIIDVPAADTDAAAGFWAGVLGASATSNADEPQFISLPGGIPRLCTAIQSVEDAGRYHLDIETDDVDAEVARLLSHGATKVSQWLDCHVLRAPGGHLLCVVPVASDPDLFDAEARTWP